MDRVCIYLRKSRKDQEAEEAETLSKHKKTLLEFAKKNGYNVIQIYEEVASGETIESRPKMKLLLEEVERGFYDAVLVMDIDRLGRGNMMDQGIIFDTFQRSHTLIITPQKTYDLNNEIDNEYSEFLAFMARKELKLITRRLFQGRIRSVQEGNYVGSKPPFGYEIKKDENGPYLVPHPEESDIVRQIFAWYTSDDPNERMGSRKIARKLNQMNIPTTTGKTWTPRNIIHILQNEVYIGRIQFKKRVIEKVRGKKKFKPQDKTEWIDVKGKHEPLIDEKTFWKAQEIRTRKRHNSGPRKPRNPLAGLLICGKCGYYIVYDPDYRGIRKPQIRCPRQCGNRGAVFHVVEEKLISELYNWINQQKIKPDPTYNKSKKNSSIKLKQKAIEKLKAEIKEYEKQQENLYNFLERGIYSEEIFMKRSATIAERIKELTESLSTLQSDLEREQKQSELQTKIIPHYEHILDIYQTTEDPAKKNILLKGILQHAIYTREEEEISLALYPKI